MILLVLWGFPKTEFQGQLLSLNCSLSESGEQMNQTQFKQISENSEHETCRDKARYDLYSKTLPNPMLEMSNSIKEQKKWQGQSQGEP